MKLVPAKGNQPTLHSRNRSPQRNKRSRTDQHQRTILIIAQYSQHQHSEKGDSISAQYSISSTQANQHLKEEE
jgi:hypothetical protein